MSFSGISYLAVLVAAIVAWLVGAGWYMALANPWIAARGRTMDDFKRGAEAAKGTPAAFMPYVIALLAELLMAWGLAGVLGHLGLDQVTVWNGVVAAFFIWLAFVLPAVGVNNMFGMRKPMLTVIDAGHWLAVLLVMGIVIGLFGV